MHRRGSSRRSSRRRNSRRRRSTMSASSRGSGRSENIMGDDDDDDLVRQLDDDDGSDRGDNDDDDDDNDDNNDDKDNQENAMRDAMAEMVNQEIILHKINRCKELIQTMQQQTWKMSKKMLVLKKARAYVEKVEGKLSRSKGYQQRWNQLIRQTKRNIVNAIAALLPWEMRIKRIESHFGSVVASYFTFLRWLIWISLWLAVLPLCFIILPEMLSGEKHGSVSRKEIPEAEKKTAYDLKTIWNAAGVVKYSLMFYGYYGNARTIGSGQYMLPLAYLLTSLAAFAFSFIVVLKTMAGNSRESNMGSSGDEFPFSWKLFTEWDFMIGNHETATTKHASIITVFKETILEEQEKTREGNKYILLSLRVTANVIILILLALSTYVIQLFVERSRQMELEKIKNPNLQAGFWNENELTIIMTMIATIFPNVLDLISVMEKYHPRTSLRLMLARIFLLNLLNLYTLFIALYNKQNDLQAVVPTNATLTSSPNCTTMSPLGVTVGVRDNCTVENSVPETSIVGGDNCWETSIGQEIYKLTIMDMVFVLGQILIVDVIRSFFIKYCNNLCCWDMEKTFPEYPDFKTAENLLHLISNQGTIWLGSFFSPGLPLLNLVKLLLLLYARCWTIMTFNAPQQRIFRASRSNNFYIALLLVMLFLCMLPPLLAIVAISPSKECGPYSGQDKIYHIITSTINNELPESATTILSYAQSPAIILPVFMLLGMTIYYLVSVSRSLKDANQRLAMQLDYERTEGRRKVYAMADAKHENMNARRSSRGWGKAKSKMLAGVQGKQPGMANFALAAVAMMNKKQEGQGETNKSRDDSKPITRQPKGGNKGPPTAPKSIKDIALQKNITSSIDKLSNKKKGVPAIPVAVVMGKRSVKINSQGNRERNKQPIEEAFSSIESSESPKPTNQRRANRSNNNNHSSSNNNNRNNNRNKRNNRDGSNQGREDLETDEIDVNRRSRSRNRLRDIATSGRRRGLVRQDDAEEDVEEDVEMEEDNNMASSEEDDDHDVADDDDVAENEDDNNSGNDDAENDAFIGQNAKKVSKVQKPILKSARQAKQLTTKSDHAGTSQKPRPDAKDNASRKTPIANEESSKQTMPTKKGSILEKIRMFQKQNYTDENSAGSSNSVPSSNVPRDERKAQEHVTKSATSFQKEKKLAESRSKNTDVDIEANRNLAKSDLPQTSSKNRESNDKSEEKTGKFGHNGKHQNRGQFLTPYSDDSEDDDDDDDDDDENDDKESDGDFDEEHKGNGGRHVRIDDKIRTTSETASVNKHSESKHKMGVQKSIAKMRDSSPQAESSATIEENQSRVQHSNLKRGNIASKHPDVKVEIVNEKFEKNSKKPAKKLPFKGKSRLKHAGVTTVSGRVPEILVEDFSDVNETVEDDDFKTNKISKGRKKGFAPLAKKGEVDVTSNNSLPSVSGVAGETKSSNEISHMDQTTVDLEGASSLTDMMKSKSRLAKWRKAASTLIKRKRKQTENNKGQSTNNGQGGMVGNILGLEDLKMNYSQSNDNNLGKLKEEKIRKRRVDIPKIEHRLPSTSSEETTNDRQFSQFAKAYSSSHDFPEDMGSAGVVNNAFDNSENWSLQKRSKINRDGSDLGSNRTVDPSHEHTVQIHYERRKNKGSGGHLSQIRASIFQDRRASLASIRSDRPSINDADSDNDNGDDIVRSVHYNPSAETFHYQNSDDTDHEMTKNKSSSKDKTKHTDHRISRVRRRDTNSRQQRVDQGRPTVIYGITNAILELESESQ